VPSCSRRQEAAGIQRSRAGDRARSRVTRRPRRGVGPGEQLVKAGAEAREHSPEGGGVAPLLGGERAGAERVDVGSREVEVPAEVVGEPGDEEPLVGIEAWAHGGTPLVGRTSGRRGGETGRVPRESDIDGGSWLSYPVGRVGDVAVAVDGGTTALPAVRPVVLVVEDDAAARAMVSRAAGAEGFAVMEAATGGSALALLRARPVQAVVLDLGLPDRDGFALLRDIRRASAAPTIVVSGDARLESRVAGLRLGADDYLVKPVAGVEIGARVAAAIRRAERAACAAPPEVVAFGANVVDLHAQELRRDGRAVALSPRELALLLFLVCRPRCTFTRAQLLDAVWPTASVDDATVTEHVRTLRGKLGEPAPPRHLVTVRGVGYRFDP
jgi:DNA-binding response OmpR family regulator